MWERTPAAAVPRGVTARDGMAWLAVQRWIDGRPKCDGGGLRADGKGVMAMRGHDGRPRAVGGVTIDRSPGLQRRGHVDREFGGVAVFLIAVERGRGDRQREQARRRAAGQEQAGEQD
jgi:hypothetical protein